MIHLYKRLRFYFVKSFFKSLSETKGWEEIKEKKIKDLIIMFERF